MKKLISVLTVFGFIFVLSACDKKADGPLALEEETIAVEEVVPTEPPANDENKIVKEGLKMKSEEGVEENQ